MRQSISIEKRGPPFQPGDTEMLSMETSEKYKVLFQTLKATL